MPPKKRTFIGRATQSSLQAKRYRSLQSLDQQEVRLEDNRLRSERSRSLESDSQRSTRNEVNRQRTSRARTQQTQEQTEIRRNDDRLRQSTSRVLETTEHRMIRREADRLRQSTSRVLETTEQREIRLEANRLRQTSSRMLETVQITSVRRAEDRLRHSIIRNQESVTEQTIREDNDRLRYSVSTGRLELTLRLGAFVYNQGISYEELPCVNIGGMNKVCNFCGARKFPMEAPGMCCFNGKVCLDPINLPPAPLSDLMSGTTDESKHFLKNIRRYNSCFQMTSFGANIINEGNFMPTFKIQGQIYHRGGSLLPMGNGTHQFLQIYFMGDEILEANLRRSAIPGTNRDLVLNLQRFFHSHNGLVQVFKTALERMPTNSHKVVIKADRPPRNEHERRFNAPTMNDVAVIISTNHCESRDIVLQKRCSDLARISESHRSYDALQYPIIFWDGQDSYNFNIYQINPSTGQMINKKVTAMQFYSHRIMIRADENHILKCRRLFLQFIVDVYVKIESERLRFCRLNQEALRVDQYIHLRDAMNNEGNVDNIGQLVILPSTFIGSPRHMNEYAQDAMTFVAAYGRPDLFITFTCNPTWSDIAKNILPGQEPYERQDIIARVFKQKLGKLMDLINKTEIFGQVQCFMYSIEWQKRGLPHSHILVWLKEKIRPSQIDDIISAEIPNPLTDPTLHKVVTKTMIHGPCGSLNPNSPCMKQGRCTKGFPKQFLDHTLSGNNGYPLYRRRKVEDGGFSTKVKIADTNVDIDNKWVVPYNPLLSRAFDAHINVEICSSVESIKYICKYVNKGHDMAMYDVTDDNSSKFDEIRQYEIGRYVSSNEAVWRILGFPIHERYPSVTHLSVHLENGQRVYFNANNAHQISVNPPETTLTAFFKLCQRDAFATTLIYSEVPTYYTWDSKNKAWQRRKKGTLVEGYQGVRKSDCLGRLYTVHPNNKECFYLRMLLNIVRGPQSFLDIKTVNGQLCGLYIEACQRYGLLEDDNHWDVTLNEAAQTSSPHQIRNLFAVILSSCHPVNPIDLWSKYREYISEDILRAKRRANPEMNIEFSSHIFKECLIKLSNICFSMCNRSLEQLGLDVPDLSASDTDMIQRAIQRERDYDATLLESYVNSQKELLNVGQRAAYEIVIGHMIAGNGGILFLEAAGGTGKTFLLNLILASVRKENDIAIAVASSGIAATLLEGGRTAHSTFKLPLDIANIENPVCNISKSSAEGRVLQEAKVIVWDECSMAHRHSLEALNTTLKDLRNSTDIMGGILLLLAGDFRQILPVIENSTPAEELGACLKSSILWKNVKKISLTTNMRVHLHGDQEAQAFTDILLKIGEGQLNDPHTCEIKLTPDLCNSVSSLDALMVKVYPDIDRNYGKDEWFRERAILAPTNICVNNINNCIQSKAPGDATSYYSIDTVMDASQVVRYPTEFLNRLEPSGFPPHKLILKVGSPVILLRNIQPPRLCNGTRLRIKKLFQYSIKAVILNGSYSGEEVFIPRIPLITTNEAFEFKRLQFPIRLCYAMTVNKAQGQSLRVVGLNLQTSCFTHGQFYVAVSRVGSPRNLFIFSPETKTRNVVYPKALQ